MAETIQRSFTAGEISPALGARADLNKYQTGLANLLNGMVHPEGGVSNRAGFSFIGYTPSNAAACRLIPFQFNTEQTYTLTFIDSKMMVIKDGEFVTNTPVGIEGISAATTAVVTMTGHGFTDGMEVFITGASALLDNQRFIVKNPTANTFEIYWLRDNTPVNSLLYFTVALGAGGTAASIFEMSHGYDSTEITELRFVQSADIMTIVHPNHDPAELQRTDHNAWTLVDVDYTTVLSAPSISSIVDSGTTETTHQKVYEYVVTAVDADGNESLPSTASVTASIVALDVTRKNTITVGAVTGATSYNFYKAESEGSGVYGYIGSSETTNFKDYNIAPNVSDSPPVDRLPFGTVGDASTTTKPSTVAYYQQRILFGGTVGKPETIDVSKTANFHSMRTSIPSKDDDSINFTIASQQVNEVRHILAVGSLLVLTSGGEWKITEGENQVLTPSTVSAKIQSYYGASRVSPVIVGHTALYVQESGSRIRDIGYTFESDSYTGSDLSVMAQHLFRNHTITDMTFAQEPHRMVWATRDDGVLLGLTYHKEHKVTGWSHHETSGDFGSLSVVKEGQEDILYVTVQRVINGNTVNTIERLHERNWDLAVDAFCVDCGLTYDSAETATIIGLHHLAGQEVICLADGNVITGLIVEDRGALVLPNPASKVHIGLPYVSEIKTLNIDSSQRMVKGKAKSIGEAVIQFYNSRGGWTGSESEFMQEIKPRFQSDNYDEMELQSYEERVAIDSGWTQGGQIIYRQLDPLPFTILAISPDVEVG